MTIGAIGDSKPDGDGTGKGLADDDVFAPPPDLSKQTSDGIEAIALPPQRSASPDPPATEEMNENMRRLLRAACSSNVLLMVGGMLFITFISREIISFCARDVIADVLYTCAAASFFISGMIQFIIDVAWTRSIPIGRYTTNKYLNITITLLFLLGVFADVVAFVFWRQGEEGIGPERKTQYISSHLWLLASIIVIVSNLKRSSLLEDKLDGFGNIFFLFESLMNVFARYVADTSPAPGQALDYVELNLELAAAVFWACNAFFYLCGDAIRIQKFRRGHQL